jgi:sulfur-carrier protein
MATVYLPSPLTALFPGAPRTLTLEASTVDELISRLDERYRGMRMRLVDAGPVIREHINIFVDGEKAALQTPLASDSEVRIIPAVSGG